MLTINCKTVTDSLVEFLQRELGRAGFSRAVLGLSGGLDSSVVAYLSARALGSENVTAFMLPYRTSSPNCLEHAALVVQQTGIRSRIVDITSLVDPFFQTFPDADRIRRGNMMARARMVVLYDQSAALQALVIGASNKSELLLGYGTLFGDMACAVNPIGELYKTQIRQLAEHLGVPREIIAKAPTADLWPGQSDEDELGFTYTKVDTVLGALVDQGSTVDEVAAQGVPRALVARVAEMIRKSAFKRRLPLIAPLPARSSQT